MQTTIVGYRFRNLNDDWDFGFYRVDYPEEINMMSLSECEISFYTDSLSDEQQKAFDFFDRKKILISDFQVPKLLKEGYQLIMFEEEGGGQTPFRNQ